MRDLTTQELVSVYGAGGCGRSSCKPAPRCGSNSRSNGRSNSKCKASKSKSRCKASKSRKHGC
jgi:hypothetical protein